MNDEELTEESPTKPPAAEPDWRKLSRHYGNMKYYAVSRAEQLKRIEDATATIDSASSNLGLLVKDMAATQAEIDEIMAAAK